MLSFNLERKEDELSSLCRFLVVKKTGRSEPIEALQGSEEIEAGMIEDVCSPVADVRLLAKGLG